MKSSKFFVATLIASATFFGASSVHAQAAKTTPTTPPPATLPNPLPNTISPSSLDCGCATSASIAVQGPNNFAASVAQGSKDAKTSAEINGAVIKTDGMASSYEPKPVRGGHGEGHSD